MPWPFRRRLTGAAAPGAEAGTARRRRDWRRLPPLRTTISPRPPILHDALLRMPDLAGTRGLLAPAADHGHGSSPARGVRVSRGAPDLPLVVRTARVVTGRPAARPQLVRATDEYVGEPAEAVPPYRPSEWHRKIASVKPPWAPDYEDAIAPAAPNGTDAPGAFGKTGQVMPPTPGATSSPPAGAGLVSAAVISGQPSATGTTRRASLAASRRLGLFPAALAKPAPQQADPGRADQSDDPGPVAPAPRVTSELDIAPAPDVTPALSVAPAPVAFTPSVAPAQARPPARDSVVKPKPAARPAPAGPHERRAPAVPDVRSESVVRAAETDQTSRSPGGGGHAELLSGAGNRGAWGSVLDGGTRRADKGRAPGAPGAEPDPGVTGDVAHSAQDDGPFAGHIPVISDDGPARGHHPVESLDGSAHNDGPNHPKTAIAHGEPGDGAVQTGRSGQARDPGIAARPAAAETDQASAKLAHGARAESSREWERVPAGVADDFFALHGVDVSDVPVRRGRAVTQRVSRAGAIAMASGGVVYLPDSAGSLSHQPVRALLAHELTHVMQQRAFAAGLPGEYSAAGIALERQAAATQHWFLHGPATAARRGTGPARGPAGLAPTGLLSAKVATTQQAGPAGALELPRLAGAPALTRAELTHPPALARPQAAGQPADQLLPTGAAQKAALADSQAAEGGPVAAGSYAAQLVAGTAAGLATAGTMTAGTMTAATAGTMTASPATAGPATTGTMTAAPRTAAPMTAAPMTAAPRTAAPVTAMPRTPRQRFVDLDDPVDLDELAARLYDRVRSRLRLELIVDRERAGLLTDFR